MVQMSKSDEAAALAAIETLRARVESEIDSLPPVELGVLLHLVRGMKVEPMKMVVLDPGVFAALGNVSPTTIVGMGGISSTLAVGGSIFASTVAQRMLRAVPHEDVTMAAWNEIIGPFYDTTDLMEWFGVSKQAISKRIGKTLLAVHALNGEVRYPSFQFLDDGRVIPNLLSVCQKLGDAGVDEWGQAQWVNSSFAPLGGRTVAQMLASDNEEDVVTAVALAESQAARLAA
jgi:hypothetical protein